MNIAFFYSGETGGGKLESRRLAIKVLLELSISNPEKYGSKIESFGNTHTLFNTNASRFGKVIVPFREQDFHIFYYNLMAGALPEEWQHPHLTDKTQYWYLGQHAGTGTHPNSIHDDNANQFQ